MRANGSGQYGVSGVIRDGILGDAGADLEGVVRDRAVGYGRMDCGDGYPSPEKNKNFSLEVAL